MISKSDPRYAAAMKVLDAMHEYWDLDPFNGAVRWIEDTEGRVVVFTRGEYKDAIRRAIGDNLKPEEQFETRELGERCENAATLWKKATRTAFAGSVTGIVKTVDVRRISLVCVGFATTWLVRY